MFERLVGLHVTDDGVYTAYRKAMSPILREHGGGFRYDFKIAETLRSESDHEINRVFAIFFPDEATSDAFFSHPDYVQAKEKFFGPSVAGTTIIAAYDRP